MQRNDAKRVQILQADERLLETQRPHEITTDQAALGGFDELCELLLVAQKISGFFRSRRQIVRMMQSDDGRRTWTRENLRHHWAIRRQQLIAAVTRIMQRGVSERRLRHDISAEVLAHVFLGMLRAWVRELADQNDAVRKHETLVEMFCYGVDASEVANVR